jgi:hypothetical protein
MYGSGEASIDSSGDGGTSEGGMSDSDFLSSYLDWEIRDGKREGGRWVHGIVLTIESLPSNVCGQTHSNPCVMCFNLLLRKFCCRADSSRLELISDPFDPPV